MSNHTTNEFAKSQEIVSYIISKYQEVRNYYNSPKFGKYKTIEEMAKPFLKGYFTLAVVGKVSSGKSTFINALLGCKDLLPTGHDQTTCGITHIEYGEEPEVTVTFGDENKITLKGKNIAEELKKYVAIPEEYHDLPVNAIDEMILAGYDFDKIWQTKEELEEKTLCATIEEDLLKKMLNSRPKAKVVTEVHIKYPFNEELKGWRIIDTPGVGAIGGIEDTTRQLLAKQKENRSREVDAIIFLQKGSETLDQTDSKKFIKEQLANFTELDKRRLFFVLTHSSDKDFIDYKESKIETIKKNYGDKIKHLTYADSFLQAFINDFKNSESDLKGMIDDDEIVLDNWSDKDLETILDILTRAKRLVKKNGDAINNETLLRQINDLANFEGLKNKINQFAKTEISKSLIELLNLIESDYKLFINRLEDSNVKLEEGLVSISKAIEELKKKRKEYSYSIGKAEKDISAENILNQFSFIDDELRQINNCYSDAINIRTAITNLFDRVQSKERKVFSQIIQTYQSSLDGNNFGDIVMQSIDFRQIEEQAKKRNQEEYVVEYKTEKHWSSPDEKIPVKWAKRVKHTEMLRDFKSTVLSKARNQRDTLKRQIKIKADSISAILSNELDKKLKEEEVRYNNLTLVLNNKEEIKKQNAKLINKISKELKDLQLKKKNYEN